MNSFYRHLAAASCLLSGIAMAEERDPLLGLNIQELMNVDVTTTSKSAKSLSKTSAAITVISQEDIRRSGANSIPDVLRFVPGLQVAQMTNNVWSVSSRGFGGVYSNKLLVMVDGRSIYNPVYGGVYWDQQNQMLEDIDRIEVVRGPGATLWGSNAVNGIINIITKSAADTQGGLVSGGGGNQETGFGALRYGGSYGENTHYRLYAKHNTRDNFDKISDPAPIPPRNSSFYPATFENNPNHDRSEDSRGGFRVDWDSFAKDSLVFQGDFYQGNQDHRLSLPSFSLPYTLNLNDSAKTSGENLLARWKHGFNTDLASETQVYWDHYRRVTYVGTEDVHTFDVDSQLNYRLNERNDIVFGGGFRHIISDQPGSNLVFYSPQSRAVSNFNLFIQDDFALIPDVLNVLVGTKYEHNGFAGSQAQPTGRLMWHINERQNVWAAVSHSVRTPVRTDQNLNIGFARFRLPGSCQSPNFRSTVIQNCQFSIVGNPAIGSEKEDSFELGYRFVPNHDWSIDVAGFYNRYHDLFTNEAGTAYLTDPQYGNTYLPYTFQQYGSAETLGLEASTRWQATRDWRLSANYSHLRTFMHRLPNSNDTAAVRAEDQNAQNTAGLRSQFNVTERVELDSTLYYMGSLPYDPSNLPGLHPGGYFRLDARIGWMPVKNLQIDLIGQNLTMNHHLEFVGMQGFVPSEIPRSLFARFQFKF